MNLLDFLSPENSSCIFCEDEDVPIYHGVCRECAEKLELWHTWHLRDGTLAMAPFLYEDEVRRSILRIKEYRKVWIAKELSGWMACSLSVRVSPLPQVVVPVPTHPIKRIGMTYSTSSVLAKSVADQLDLLFADHALQRHHYAFPMMRTNMRWRDEKRYCPGKQIAWVQGKDVVLVDDVCTTGRTLMECALVLKEAGASSVVALTLARAGRRKRREEKEEEEQIPIAQKADDGL